MKYTKYFAGCALAVGLFAAGIPAASAQVQYGNPYYRQDDRNRYSGGYRSGNSYDRIEELQQHIDHDQAKLDEAIRCGNDAEAARQAADVARDQRELRELQSGQNARYNYAPAWNRGWNFRLGWR
jgi:hypothetical protein